MRNVRYWEIDEARGRAVVLMVFYHFIFDLFYPENNQFYWLAILTATFFILVSGVSLSVSYSRGAKFKKFIKRGLKLLVLGLFITAVSFLLLGKGVILFGILHFFGVSSFLVYPFLKNSRKNITLFIGVSFILVGMFFWNVSINTNYLIWVGLTPRVFYTFDFFPTFPWFGLLLIGTYIGSHMYPNGKRGFKIHEPDNIMSKTLQLLGKNSLIIYFIHQPIMILLLYVLGMKSIIFVLI